MTKITNSEDEVREKLNLYTIWNNNEVFKPYIPKDKEN